MKRISLNEFRDRTETLIRARKIFIPNITKNITVAFELYQEVLAEQERVRFLSTVTGGKVSMTWLDQYERPKCPECGKDLYLRLINKPKGSSNAHGYKTCWECVEENCLYEKYSAKTINDWVTELRRKPEH